MLFDTHFHLDLVKDPLITAQQIERQQIYTIAVTNLPAVFSHTEQLCAGLKFVRPALGYHPELAARHFDQLGVFAELLDRTKYIGEVGLDNLKKTPQDYQVQKRIFEQIVALCAAKADKILTVHSRRAVTDVLAIIGKGFPGKVILHWFSGSLKEMELALAHGCYFSINLNMLQSQKGKELIKALPSDRILLETDGPFTIFEGQPCLPAVSKVIANGITALADKNRPDFGKNFKALLAPPIDT